jgi:hypothetical protein
MRATCSRCLVAYSIIVLGLAWTRPGACAAADAVPESAPPAEPAAAGPDSLSEGDPFQLEWEATYASWYSFQGIDYSNRRPVFQPGLKGTLKRLSVGVWGNLDQSREELNEVDLTLEWGWESHHASGGLGYVNLQYPHRADWEPSQEVLGEVAFDAPLKPSASVHWDVDKGRGRYWTFGIEHEVPEPGAAILLAAKLYAQDHYYGMTGISAVETSVGIRRLWGGMVWEPSLARLWSWGNGDYQGANAAPAGWLLSVSVSPP